MLTSVFSHQSGLHFLFNSIAFYSFGSGEPHRSAHRNALNDVVRARRNGVPLAAQQALRQRAEGSHVALPFHRAIRRSGISFIPRFSRLHAGVEAAEIDQAGRWSDNSDPTLVGCKRVYLCYSSSDRFGYVRNSGP